MKKGIWLAAMPEDAETCGFSRGGKWIIESGRNRNVAGTKVESGRG